MRLSSTILSLSLSILIAFSFSSAQLMSGKNLDVIRVGTSGISQGKIDSLAHLLGQQQSGGRPIPPEAMKQLRWAVVDNLVGQELLKLEIKKQKIKVPNTRVDSLVTIFKSQFPSEDAFQKELKKTNVTMKQFKEKIEQQLQSEVILEKMVPYPNDPTEKEMEAYWELNKKKVQINDSVSGAQIILKTTKGESKTSLDDKKELLKGLAAQVRMGKATFAMLAAQYSDDPKAKTTGGVLERFLPSTKGKAFVDALSKMKVGDISGVINTNEGLMLFMLTEKNDGKYESYKHQIDYILRVNAEQERQMAVKKYLDSLAKVYKVQYFNKDYTPPEAIGEVK